ncbi:MAG: methylenetetrahydrofolate reductase [Bacteroidales bacterium]
MNIPEHIEQNKGGGRISVELLPPVKGNSIHGVFKTLDPIMEFAPPYINITYHREELNYIRQADGTHLPAVVRKRPGTVGLAAAIQAKYRVDVVPHIICGGFTRTETEEALIELDFLGIRNLLAVRGDPDKVSGRFVPNPKGHTHAADLVKQIMAMNQGVYHENHVENPVPTNFSVGVAGYPEKHPESPNQGNDMDFLKMKVERGAQYIVTQMFFDNEVFFDFVRKCREAGIRVPIVPGLKPLAIKAHLSLLPKFFHLTIPQELSTAINRCADDRAVKELGVEWTSHQIKSLFKSGFPIVHLYTMGKADNIVQIARKTL